jgi:hypothetical protein
MDLADDFAMIPPFTAAFASAGLESFAALCAIFTVGLVAFLESFGACLVAPFKIGFALGFAFVLPAIIHSAQNSMTRQLIMIASFKVKQDGN